MEENRAVDLPVGSVIATTYQVWIKRAAYGPHTTSRWVPGDWDDDGMDRALADGAVVLRHGDGQEG